MIKKVDKMRVNKILCILILSYGIVFNPYNAYATFEMSVSHAFIDFGFMQIGEFKEIEYYADEEYHNEVTCKSDKGDTWYLKIHLAEPLRSGEYKIPPENFKWKIVEVINGAGYATNKNEFNDFSTVSQVVYISSPEDNAGTEVKIRFTYGLKIPQTQITGNYETVVRYTLTEML